MDNKHVAVLIDADNVSTRWISAILEEAATAGNLALKRVYGDFGRSDGWRSLCAEHAIQPMQQYPNTKGKNASDIFMVIDAMDLLHTRRYNTFCLISSDSDFSSLATRLRQDGVTVWGFGEQKTPEAFRKACSQFKYVEILQAQSETEITLPEHAVADESLLVPKQEVAEPQIGANVTAPPPFRVLDQELRQLLELAVEKSSTDDGWANLGGVGSLLVQWKPDFDSRNYGYKKLSVLAQECGWFDSKPCSNGKTGILLRKRTETLSRDALGKVLVQAISISMAGDWAPLRSVRRYLPIIHNGFRIEDYGVNNLEALIDEQFSSLIEKRSHAGQTRFIRLAKNKPAPKASASSRPKNKQVR